MFFLSFVSFISFIHKRWQKKIVNHLHLWSYEYIPPRSHSSHPYIFTFFFFHLDSVSRTELTDINSSIPSLLIPFPNYLIIVSVICEPTWLRAWILTFFFFFFRSVWVPLTLNSFLFFVLPASVYDHQFACGYVSDPYSRQHIPRIPEQPVMWMSLQNTLQT